MRPSSVLVVAALATGCITDNLERCADGTACPRDRTCDNIHGGCVGTDQITVCDGQPDGAACMFGTTTGHCDRGVCVWCGDGIVDPGEVCDDGNLGVRDGCTPDCASDETCGNRVVDVAMGETCDDGNHIRGDGCDSVCRKEAPEWTRFAYPDPTMRHVMTFDAARDELVVLDDQGRTWVRHHTTWRLAATTGPGPRIDAGIAYDPIRKRVVLFGGFAAQDVDRETWEWDGHAWSRREPAVAPTRRSHPALAWDPSSKRVLLFGGTTREQAADVLAHDTWTWDGTTWTEVTPSASPPGLAEPAMSTDPRRGRVVLIGGLTIPGVFTLPGWQQVWEWDGASWTEIPTICDVATCPTLRLGARTAYDPELDATVLVAGYTHGLLCPGPPIGCIYPIQPLGDVWVWNGAWTPLGALPAPIWGHQLAYQQQTGLIVFGGEPATTPVNTLYTWGGTSWRLDGPPPSTAAPSAIWYPAVAHDPSRAQTLYVGGMTPSTVIASSEAWILEGDTWGVANPLAPGRFNASAVYDRERDYAVVFGGWATVMQATALADAWARHPDGTWTALAFGPSARAGAAMAYDEARREVILFGGETPTGSILTTPTFHRDTWRWNGAWNEVRGAHGSAFPRGPSARSSAAMAFDPVRSQIVLFGGKIGGGGLNEAVRYSSETWLWDGSAWSLATPEDHPPESASKMVWDPRRQRIVLFGGATTTGVYGSTWEWDGSTWRLLATAGPAPRSGHAMVADIAHASVLVLGGIQASDTWTLSWASDSPRERCETDVDVDDGLAGCADADCWGVCTPTCPPYAGASCAGASPRCGDGVCDDFEDCRSCATDCMACPVVCGDWICDGGEAVACPGDCP
jgi:cysteine-rich repeat protein